MRTDWAEAVSASPPSIVLPPGGRRAKVEVPGPLVMESVLDLGAGHVVAVIRAADGSRWCVPAIRTVHGVRRSAAGDGTAERLVGLLATGQAKSGTPGVTGADGYSWRGFDGRPVVGEREVGVDQTNESVIVGEEVVVKWSTRLPDAGEPGSPAADRITALVEAGFADMPTPRGFLHAESEYGREQLLAAVVQYLPGAEDGWDWATGDLRALLRGDLSMERAIEPARRLGEITARMHAGLASLGVEAASAEQVRRWSDQAIAELVEATSRSAGTLADRLRTWQERITDAYRQLAHLAGTPTIAVHGDLHVGQVLRSGGPGGEDRLLITDFDGNPTLSMAERWDRQPAAVDVVGMLASLDHVGRIVQYRDEGADLPAIRTWIERVQQSYLDAYRAQAAALGIDHLLEERLLEPLRLRQEVREVRYAVQHLPHWVYVPDLALADLLDDPYQEQS